MLAVNELLLLLAADGNHLRNLWPIKMKWATVRGVPSPKSPLYSTPPTHTAPRTAQERRQKDFKSQSRKTTPIKSHKFGHVNRAGPMTMWVGVNLTRPYHSIKSWGDQWRLREDQLLLEQVPCWVIRLVVSPKQMGRGGGERRGGECKYSTHI